jgi:DNA repair exonuclease SbcCD ATPase subunit
MSDLISPSDEERVQAIRERLAKLTPGPWIVCPTPDAHEGVWAVRQANDHADGWWIANVCEFLDNDDTGELHAAFIANSRADLDYLLRENDALREQRDALAKAGRNAGHRIGDLEGELSTARAALSEAETRIKELETALDQWNTMGRFERMLDSTEPHGNPASAPCRGESVK